MSIMNIKTKRLLAPMIFFGLRGERSWEFLEFMASECSIESGVMKMSSDFMAVLENFEPKEIVEPNFSVLES